MYRRRVGCCRASAATEDEKSSRLVSTSDLKALAQDDEEETMEHEAQAPNVRGRYCK
jgi:hypothetical protein